MEAAFAAVQLGIFLDVFNAVATTGKRKGDAVRRLVQYFRASAGGEEQRQREEGTTQHVNLVCSIVEWRKLNAYRRIVNDPILKRKA